MAGIYLHIPFCKQACSYCNFHFSTNFSKKGELVDALVREIEMRRSYLNQENISSIYFGGGTPSLLNSKELKYLFAALYKHFSIAADAEITLEANPDDLTKEKLNALKKTPINRLSIGVQSFFEKDLRFMNRAHTSEEAIKSIYAAQDFGFDELNMDLIFGSPSTTDEMWEANLQQFYDLNIPHLSAYSLTVEEKTALAHQIKSGKSKAVDEAQNYRQYQMLQNSLKANGFEQYELSNYCSNNNYAKHNTAYWQGEKYLGIGPAAHSYNGDSRQWNISNNPLYIKGISKKETYFEIENLSEIDRYHEFLITSLRTKWGVKLKDMEQFSPKINRHFYKIIKSLPAAQLQQSDERIKVNPSYLFQSDEIVRMLMMNQ